jgi:hypothetical protein
MLAHTLYLLTQNTTATEIINERCYILFSHSFNHNEIWLRKIINRETVKLNTICVPLSQRKML